MCLFQGGAGKTEGRRAKTSLTKQSLARESLTKDIAGFVKLSYSCDYKIVVTIY